MVGSGGLLERQQTGNIYTKQQATKRAELQARQEPQPMLDHCLVLRKNGVLLWRQSNSVSWLVGAHSPHTPKGM